MKHLDKLRSHFFQEAELFLSIYDKDLNCIDVNEAFLKLFRCEREDLIGKNLCEISPDLKANGRYELYKEVIRTGNAIIINDMQPHPSIGNLHFRIRAFKVDGGLGLIVKNITDLVESIDRFNYATNASKEIIYEWDINNNSVWWNQIYYELIGAENENNLLGFDSWIKFIHPEDLDKVLKSITEFLEGEGTYWSAEYRFLGRNNNVHYFAERAFIIRGKTGKPSKKIASVTDITNWQLNINHLEDILFALSHKVRQPVANILGISNLLDDELMDEKELKRITGYMKESVNSLDKFTKEMTNLVSAHKLKVENRNWA
ncbi:MAG: PAS domain-containing protein [Bacteroidota bacterium]|nr:PAS domain-containing protein [Bacteroidota bacterium]